MSWVDIKLFKQHVRADDFSDDDDYMLHLLETAEAWVLRETNRTESELVGQGGGKIPPPLRQAVMLLAGHWYNQREAVAGVQMHEVPYTLKALVKPYIKLVDDAGGTDEV